MPTCSDIIVFQGPVDGWLKVGHVVDGQFLQLFGYEDTADLGVRGAISSAQSQGFCTVPPTATETVAVEIAEVDAMPISADPQGGIDPVWGLAVLGGIGAAFVGGAIAIYRGAVAKARQRSQYQATRLAYPTAGVYEPNPFGRQPSQNPFARALDEVALMDIDQNSTPANQSDNCQESGRMVQVYPRSHHRTTTDTPTPESNEVVGVVVDSHHRTTTESTTAPPMPGAASTDPFDYAPFSFFASSVSPYERACVWVALGESMSQRDALEKIYGIPDSQKNSANWVKARDRYQDIKFDIELQIQKQDDES